ncbi:hypothetical protein E1B28_011614 [Marasmius oreades]|uniref:FAR-17a/AIG1-like protein n=1 Tax=Marasmius oreades TaxID=181124 RepID=A0A9P7RV34_9AGAR|nr:uncharacterized protein E1B28_011614 [Marasmius oreades]KAG7089992.1 hypothetical protein E1B28_011614 [Marasmius oreades]
MAKAATLFGAGTLFDPSHKLVTSPFFSPTLLAWFRASVALYTTAMLIFILAYDSVVTKDAGTNFSYFTFLTYIGICSYYWASFVQTFWYIRRGFEGYPLQSWGKTLQILHLMLRNTVLTFPIIVTIAFWTLVATPSSVATTVNLWRNISVHALNSLFCVFEMLLTNNPSPQWIFLPVMILIIGLYTALAYVTRATQGFYPYTFLDPGKYHSVVAAFFFGIVIGEVVIFTLAWGLMKLREMKFPVRSTGSDDIAIEMKEQDRDSV